MTEIKNIESYADVFTEVVQTIQQKQPSIRDEIKDRGHFFLVSEENRAGHHFVHIVPKEVFDQFRILQIRQPHSQLGNAVLVGRKNGKNVYVNLFGVTSEFWEDLD